MSASLTRRSHSEVLHRILARLKVFHLACVAGLFALAAHEVSALTLYVDAAKGSDKNDGSIKSPYKTIQKAAKIAVPGDVVAIHEGTIQRNN